MRPNTSTQSTFTNTHKYENPPQMYTNTSLSTYTSKNIASKPKSSPNVGPNENGSRMYTNTASSANVHKYENRPQTYTNASLLTYISAYARTKNITEDEKK